MIDFCQMATWYGTHARLFPYPYRQYLKKKISLGLMRMVVLLVTGPYSPELSPTGHAWATLEERIYKCSDMGSSDGTKKEKKKPHLKRAVL